MDRITPPPKNDFQRIRPSNEDYDYFEESHLYPFNYSAQGFDNINAWRLSDSAFLAYTSNSFAKQQFEKLGLNKFQPFSKGSTQCYVANNDEYSILSFRGTEIQDSNGIQDFIIDIRFNLTESLIGGKVHDGFKEALDLIWYENSGLHEYLQQLITENPTIKLWFTGHSLGAALAVLAAGRFRHFQGLYTYGCPKIGNSEFTNSFPLKSNFYRFVNNSDLIPDLPFTDPVVSQTTTNDIPFIKDFGLPRIPIPIPKFPEQYQQIGELKYFDRDGNLASRTDSLDIFFDRVLGTTNNLVGSASNLMQLRLANFPASIADHAPIFYSVNTRNSFVDSLTISNI